MKVEFEMSQFDKIQFNRGNSTEALFGSAAMSIFRWVTSLGIIVYNLGLGLG